MYCHTNTLIIQNIPIAAMDVEVTTLPTGLEEYLPGYKEALSDGFYIRQKTSKNDDWNEEECLLQNLNLYVCCFASMFDEYVEIQINHKSLLLFYCGCSKHLC